MSQNFQNLKIFKQYSQQVIDIRNTMKDTWIQSGIDDISKRFNLIFLLFSQSRPTFSGVCKPTFPKLRLDMAIAQ